MSSGLLSKSLLAMTLKPWAVKILHGKRLFNAMQCARVGFSVTGLGRMIDQQ